MRKTKSLFLTACLAAAGMLSGSENLLYNGSFEISAGKGKAEGWSGEYTREPNGTDGKFSIKCHRTGTGYTEGMSSSFPVMAGKEIALTGKYRGCACIVYMTFQLKNGKKTALHRNLNAAKDWTSFELKGKAPADAVSGAVHLRTWDKQNPVWFDSVKVSSDGLRDILKNGSFEIAGPEKGSSSGWSGLGTRVPGGIDGSFMGRCLSPQNHYSEFNSHQMQVKPGSKYHVAGMSKGSDFVLFVMFERNGKTSIVHHKGYRSSPDWKFFSFQGTVPEDSGICRLLLRSTSKKDPVFFDGVRLITEDPVERKKEVSGITVRIDGDVTPALQTAQSELTHYLPRVIKKHFKINGVPLRTIKVSRDDSLRNEEWKIKSEGDTLFLSGGGTRGTLYAVYHFLEDMIGIHWWNTWEEYVPPAKDWDLPKLAKQGKPCFTYRDIYRKSIISSDNGRFAIRNRLNRNGDPAVSAAYGGSYTWGPPYHVHTFSRYIHGGYRKIHPDFFSVVDGKREGGQYTGQLCLTNKKLRQHLVELVINNIRFAKADALSKGVEPPKMYDLSMNDGERFCECAACKKMENAGNISDVMLDFINEIAAGVEKKYPEVLITTLAYGKTAVPPKTGIKPRKNVLMRFCNTFGSTVYPSEPRNKDVMEKFKGWAKISPQIMGWEACLESYPFPYEMGLAELYQNYVKHNYMGAFTETPIPYSGDCYDMKVWLICKMLEDPFSNLEAHRQIFLRDYYGKAGPMIDKYRKLLDKAQRRVRDKKLNRYFAKDFAYMNINELLQSHKLFDQAEKAVENDPLLMRRVVVARVPLNLLTGYMIAHYTNEWKKIGGTAKDFPIDRTKLASAMRKYWFQDAERYPDSKNVKATMEGQIAFSENLAAEVKPIPFPPEFKGKTVHHFTPSKLVMHPTPNMKLVKDPDASESCAIEAKNVAGPRFFDLPFEMGAYDLPGAKTLLQKQWKTLPEGDGYHWLHLGSSNFHMMCYIYVTRSWCIQAKFNNYLEYGAKDLDVWCRVKFEGPAYGKKGKENRILVDCVSVIELK